MINVTSIATSPVDFSDSAIGSMDGNVLNRYKTIINFYFAKFTAQKKLQLTGSTLSNINALDNESFLDLVNDGLPLLPGEKFKISGSSTNTGEFTIATVSDTSLTITGTFTTETIQVAYVYVTSKPTSMDFYYNLIGNTEQPTFVSKTDKGVLQKYIVSGIDPSVLTTTLLNIGTKSMAWVTDIVTGIASTSTIQGAGITGSGQTYQQAFTITHYYTQAPFFLPNFNFPNKPIYYQPGNLTGSTIQNGGIQYIFQIGLKYNSTDTVPQNTFLYANNDGTGCWVNENSLGTNPDFSMTSISYVDDATSLPLSAIDLGKTNDVTIVIASASGAFTAGTKIDLCHFYGPTNDADYQNTPTTLLQNYMNDRIAFMVGGGAVNGLFFGGNYSIIQGASAVLNSASKITITFKAIYTTFLKNYLIARDGNNNYGFTVATE